ncbi:hypothetical protein K435DRAFT_795770 [Dendrothele bispora CBS 962.96]|uniref:Uncharacterized protein n=1 Tax=Dendrothele bispora (strain CBS 962.96) TaxID=1314807 RepID=A0A4S8M7T1_DENBC|nr:hypothetical protein K435DRAFT_795770 [Dendrothele bispora CBS 962.96]
MYPNIEDPYSYYDYQYYSYNYRYAKMERVGQDDLWKHVKTQCKGQVSGLIEVGFNVEVWMVLEVKAEALEIRQWIKNDHSARMQYVMETLGLLPRKLTKIIRSTGLLHTPIDLKLPPYMPQYYTTLQWDGHLLNTFNVFLGKSNLRSGKEEEEERKDMLGFLNANLINI